MNRRSVTRGLPARPVVDVLLVQAGSTPGLRRAEGDLHAALQELGVVTAVATTDYHTFGRWRVAQPLIDLVEVANIHRATTLALRQIDPRAIIYPTSLSTIFESSKRLRIAAVRFDALARENRTARRNLVQRRLERRSLGKAQLLVPFSITDPSRLTGSSTTPIIVLPPLIAASHSQPETKEPVVLCYAANPYKKGLDLIVEAWAQVQAQTDHCLAVAGIGLTEGRAFLRRRGVTEPSGITWLGLLDTDAYRSFTARAEVFLAASRYEDFGIAPLEAMVDGTILVTMPSKGPFEALHLARQLDDALVARTLTANGLAAALSHALTMNTLERQVYREGAARLLMGYSRHQYLDRLRTGVLPALLGTNSRR